MCIHRSSSGSSNWNCSIDSSKRWNRINKVHTQTCTHTHLHALEEEERNHLFYSIECNIRGYACVHRSVKIQFNGSIALCNTERPLTQYSKLLPKNSHRAQLMSVYVSKGRHWDQPNESRAACKHRIAVCVHGMCGKRHTHLAIFCMRKSKCLSLHSREAMKMPLHWIFLPFIWMSGHTYTMVVYDLCQSIHLNDLIYSPCRVMISLLVAVRVAINLSLLKC